MTGFDETVPPDDDADDTRPEHDSTTPAFEDEPEPDEPKAMAGDDDLRAGQYGPDPTR